MSRILIFIWGTLLFLSCDSESEKQAHEYKSYVVVNGDTLHVTRYDNSVLSTVAYVDGEALSAQGCAIKDNFLYRFYDRGYCKVFQIHDDYNLSYVKEFKLGSYRGGNHCNCAQFDRETGLLYASEFYQSKCNIERISLESGTSELIQEITIEKSEKLNFRYLNIVKGDDGYLWAMGGPIEGPETLFFYKFNAPDLSKPRITLTDKDIVDSWTFEDGMYTQGGVVNDGYIYFLFGVASVQKKILIFNTQNHNLVQLLNLDDVILEEPEDIDFVGKKLIVTVYGNSAYYVIDLQKLLMKLE